MDPHGKLNNLGGWLRTIIALFAFVIIFKNLFRRVQSSLLKNKNISEKGRISLTT